MRLENKFEHREQLSLELNKRIKIVFDSQNHFINLHQAIEHFDFVVLPSRRAQSLADDRDIGAVGKYFHSIHRDNFNRILVLLVVGQVVFLGVVVDFVKDLVEFISVGFVGKAGFQGGKQIVDCYYFLV